MVPDTAVARLVPASYKGFPKLPGPMAPLSACSIKTQCCNVAGEPHASILTETHRYVFSRARKWLTEPGEAAQTHIAQLLWNAMVWFLTPDIPGLLNISMVWCDGRLLDSHGKHGPANISLQRLALRVCSLHTNGKGKGTYFTCHGFFYYFLFFLILTRNTCLFLTCVLSPSTVPWEGPRLPHSHTCVHTAGLSPPSSPADWTVPYHSADCQDFWTKSLAPSREKAWWVARHELCSQVRQGCY